MHEFSLVESILECVLRLAQENGGLEVERIELDIGSLQQVVPEALQMAFDAAKTGTLAQNAVLEWTFIPLEITCPKCDMSHYPEAPPWSCPRCGAMGGRVSAGDELIVKRVFLSEETAGIKGTTNEN